MSLRSCPLLNRALDLDLPIARLRFLPESSADILKEKDTAKNNIQIGSLNFVTSILKDIREIETSSD